MVPKIPKINRRLDEIEESYLNLKTLFPDLCLRLETQTLISQIKQEVNVYVDGAMRQWDFEYRKGFLEMQKKYEEILTFSKEILPKKVFKVRNGYTSN